MIQTDTLPERLIAASIDLLDESGPTGLTLRRAAARAGVSHAAPAHHFDGLPGLQTAVAARAFDLFTRAMTDRRDRAAKDPFARLLAICEGYLDFAQRHGGLFHIMFLCADVARDDAQVWPAAGRAYEVLRQGCLAFSGGVPDPVLEATVWTSVHGYALLGFTTPGGQANGAPPPPFDQVLRQVLGLKSRSPDETGPAQT
jgi:AcrR family transcriptional regulator